MYQNVYTMRSKTSSTFNNWKHFPLEAVDLRAANYCLGKAFPKLDGVRKEGSLVDLSSGKGTSQLSPWP